MNAPSEKRRNLTQKSQRGSVLSLNSFFPLSLAPYLARKTKLTSLYHPKDHRRLFDSIVKPTDLQEREMSY